MTIIIMALTMEVRDAQCSYNRQYFMRIQLLRKSGFVVKKEMVIPYCNTCHWYLDRVRLLLRAGNIKLLLVQESQSQA